MKKGILFFDVDGTLVDSEHGKILPEPEVLDAIQKVRKNGYYCIISSGRNMAGLSMFEKSLFDGFVFSDGAGIKLAGKEAEVIAFEHEMLSEILQELIEKYGCDVNACWQDGSFVTPKIYEKMHGFFDFGKGEAAIQKVMAEQNIMLIDQWENEKILETDIFFPDAESKKTWIKKKPDTIEFLNMENNYGEITPKGVTKASGCLHMCEVLGVDMKECYAFGDSMNDEAMLKSCGKAIVMGNGDERLKKSADYVTARIEEGGLIQAFIHYGLM